MSDEQPEADREQADLRLAKACLRGDSAAKDALHRLIADVAARIRWVDLELAERVARIWTHILDPDPQGHRRLASYDGRGPLGGWLRVVGARLANYDRRKTESPTAPEDALVAWWAAAATAEQDAIKDIYLDDVRQAFRGAVRALSEGDRLLLHMHYRQGVTLEALTGFYNVHRVTLSRRIGAARQRILEHAVSSMTEKSSMTAHECRSLLRTLQSRIEISFGST
ncbi:MAG: hypothetical protein ACRBN8_36445 [Nannocystales bacterium]